MGISAALIVLAVLYATLGLFTVGLKTAMTELLTGKPDFIDILRWFTGWPYHLGVYAGLLLKVNYIMWKERNYV